MKTLNYMKIIPEIFYLYDSLNGSFEEFESMEKVKDYIMDIAHDSMEGWHPDIETILILRRTHFVTEENNKLVLKNIQESEDIKGLDNPYPLKDVLKKLADAADILLHEKNYDGNNYEEIEVCAKRAKEIIKLCEKI